MSPGAEADLSAEYQREFPERYLVSPIQSALCLLHARKFAVTDRAFGTALLILHALIEREYDAGMPPPLLFTLFVKKEREWVGQKASKLDHDLILATLKARLSARYPGGNPPRVLSLWPKDYTRFLLGRLQCREFMSDELGFAEQRTQEATELLRNLCGA